MRFVWLVSLLSFFCAFTVWEPYLSLPRACTKRSVHSASLMGKSAKVAKMPGFVTQKKLAKGITPQSKEKAGSIQKPKPKKPAPLPKSNKSGLVITTIKCV